jgi:hypothetical protein
MAVVRNWRCSLEKGAQSQKAVKSSRKSSHKQTPVVGVAEILVEVRAP